MSYLLDTCVISETVRNEPDPRVLAWMGICPEDSLYLSSLTFGELERGIARLPDSPKKVRLAHWVNEDLSERFAGRILPVTQEVAVAWGKLRAAVESRGKPLPVIDALIAATARVHHLTLATRDISLLTAEGIEVLNPWKD